MSSLTLHEDIRALQSIKRKILRVITNKGLKLKYNSFVYFIENNVRYPIIEI